MARIPREIVEEVRERADIAAVIGRHVQLQRRGSRLVGLCPFHQEKTPSFHVIPERTMFYCFGCQAGGDVFKFLMEVEGLGFAEAVKELAQQTGVEVPERELTPAERRAIRARATMYDVLEAACSQFESSLWTSQAGQAGRDYLKQRGITDETSRAARLGFAPEGWRFLSDALTDQGYSPRLLVEAGLVKQKDGRRIFDAYRNRLIIPIRDEKQRVIGFGGRDMSDAPRTAKYINSTETALYKKSSVLYGLAAARRAIDRRDRVIIVEGYFDVLSLQQAGFHEAVATCGTALTPQHVQRLQRLTRQAIVLLDADEAGARAAERTLPLFVKAGVEAWRLQLPDAKDPDELIQDGGPEAMEAALTLRVPLMHWVARRKLEQQGYTPTGKEHVLRDMLETMGEPSPAQLSELAGILRLKEAFVIDEAAKIRQQLQRLQQDSGDNEAGAQPPTPAVPMWRPHRDVVHLFWLMVHRYEAVADLLDKVDMDVLAGHAPAVPALARLLSGEPVANIIDDETDEGVRKTLMAVVGRERLYDAEQATLALFDILARLEKPQNEAKMAALTDEVMRCSREGDTEGSRHALAERMRLKQRELALQQTLSAGDIPELTALFAPLAPDPSE